MSSENTCIGIYSYNLNYFAHQAINMYRLIYRACFGYRINITIPHLRLHHLLKRNFYSSAIIKKKDRALYVD
jgi:hypothetical protein